VYRYLIQSINRPCHPLISCHESYLKSQGSLQNHVCICRPIQSTMVVSLGSFFSSMKLIGTHRTQIILLDFKSFKWESSFMAFLIVLNNKEPDFSYGDVVILHLKWQYFLQIPERHKSQLLSCYHWRTNNMCRNRKVTFVGI
jgi:hypothetical protein